MEIKNRDGKVCVYTFIKNIKELYIYIYIYIYIYLKIYLLLIHMFKKITKLSCSFFCNFDCFHMREPSGFLMLLLLLLLLFLNPEGFYFRYSSGSYRQVCFHRDPFYTFSPTSRLFLVTTHSFPFYRGEAVHLTEI